MRGGSAAKRERLLSISRISIEFWLTRQVKANIGQFWLDRLADPRNDLSPEKKQKILSQIRRCGFVQIKPEHRPLAC
jgi:hypothetical protein